MGQSIRNRNSGVTRAVRRACAGLAPRTPGLAGQRQAAMAPSVPDQSLKYAIGTLTNALRAKDPYTGAHSGRVSMLATLIAHEMGMPADICADVTLGATLHDIGKIGISGKVLHRAGPLSEADMKAIRLHPTIGEEILAPMLRHRPGVLAIVRSHHERMDGTGYPDGLKGAAIPIAARIVSVADAFDAMTSHRPYRPGLSVTEAIDQLLRFSDSQFDRQCVQALVRLIRRGAFRITPRLVPGQAQARCAPLRDGAEPDHPLRVFGAHPP